MLITKSDCVLHPVAYASKLLLFLCSKFNLKIMPASEASWLVYDKHRDRSKLGTHISWFPGRGRAWHQEASGVRHLLCAASDPQPPLVMLSCSYLVGFHIGRGKTQLIVTHAGTVHVLSIGMSTSPFPLLIPSDKRCLPTNARTIWGHAGMIL